MKLHRTMRQTCLWMLSAAALCSLTACFGGSDDDKLTYWQATAHDKDTGHTGTEGDIFGGFN